MLTKYLEIKGDQQWATTGMGWISAAVAIPSTTVFEVWVLAN